MDSSWPAHAPYRLVWARVGLMGILILSISPLLTAGRISKVCRLPGLGLLRPILNSAFPASSGLALEVRNPCPWVVVKETCDSPSSSVLFSPCQRGSNPECSHGLRDVPHSSKALRQGLKKHGQNPAMSAALNQSPWTFRVTIVQKALECWG